MPDAHPPLPESENAGPVPPRGARPSPSLPANHERLHWLKAHSFWFSLGAIIVSGISAFSSCRSSNFAELSARAALTNANWASYQLNPHHDLIARVLKVGFYTRGMAPESTNGAAFVDLALINNGNQSEIIRRVSFYYLQSPDSSGGPVTWQELNTQLAKGEKQVLHLTLDHGSVFTGKTVWLTVGVTAIGTDAQDIESCWLTAMFTLAADGNGGGFSPLYTNAISIVSDHKLPTQHTVQFSTY